MKMEYNDVSTVCQCFDDIFLFTGLFTDRHFFLKPLNPYSEDRVCFERIPNSQIELHQFLQRYESRITPDSPYFVSEFIKVSTG